MVMTFLAFYQIMPEKSASCHFIVHRFRGFGISSAGDRLLEVDGISFQGFTYQQAVECLRNTGEVMTDG